MEDVLDVYHLPYDSACPVVCFDEASKELHDDLIEGSCIQPKRTSEQGEELPGHPVRQDHHYERHGVANLFMFYEPLAGERHVSVTKQHTRLDFARCMKWLVDEQYPDVLKIRLVLDNLSAHKLSALYELYEPEEAKRIKDKLELHFTPKHGSWLNMAEIELSVLRRQCLDRRIPSDSILAFECRCWEERRNRSGVGTDWQFTTQDARIKLKKLYPSVPD